MSIFVYVVLGVGCVRNGLGIVPAGAMLDWGVEEIEGSVSSGDWNLFLFSQRWFHRVQRHISIVATKSSWFVLELVSAIHLDLPLEKFLYSKNFGNWSTSIGHWFSQISTILLSNSVWAASTISLLGTFQVFGLWASFVAAIASPQIQRYAYWKFSPCQVIASTTAGWVESRDFKIGTLKLLRYSSRCSLISFACGMKDPLFVRLSCSSLKMIILFLFSSYAESIHADISELSAGSYAVTIRFRSGI